MAKFRRIFFITLYILFLFTFSYTSNAQVNAVEFGRNRVQYEKFKWEYYQTKNFNSYFNQNGKELGKYVAQIAEKELPSIEAFVEYKLRRRLNIVIYNEFADLQQSNIGANADWQTTGGVTQLVNNKMVVYFNGDHTHLRRQIREGIARLLTENILFGDDIGEYASNKALLDLPKWLVEGYIAFTAENWSTALDDELKDVILSGNYTKFNSLAYDNPLLAGHAFWYYIEERYKKENVTYFLYLTRVYKNLNKASMQICKKKFKDVLKDFMEYEEEKYYKDVSRRKAYPKGNFIESFELGKRKDYYRINVNPNKKNNSFAVVEYKKGIVRVKLSEDFEYKTILRYGIRSYKNETNPDYPLLAWDPKGTKLTVIYNKAGRLKLFVYDITTGYKYPMLDLTDTFTQIQDVKYMVDSKILLLSATKNGHTDIFTFDIEKQKVKQVTNDIYDDLDATFVAFPNKTGILFSSNRPSPNAKDGDTILPSNNRYNIFLATNFEGDIAEVNQITQLSNLEYGNARYPTPYNINHFTFISDENGVGNRYAGFFTTKSAGLDTVILIGDDILRNPSITEIDSTLAFQNKTTIDSMIVVKVSEDSAYTFPLSNYESSVAETRVAGVNNQVSEITKQDNEKILYKLKIDENTLRQRNINVPPTEYMKRIVMADKIFKETNLPTIKEKTENSFIIDTTQKEENIFQSEFSNETISTINTSQNKVSNSNELKEENILKTARLYKYKPLKFSADYGGAGLGSTVLFNRYQKYANGQGPVQMGTNTPLNALVRIGTSDLMEDIKVIGAYRLSTNLKDNEWLISYQNYRKRLDWSFTYYRKGLLNPIDNISLLYSRTITNLVQGSIAYPFDNARRISLSIGIRNDRVVYLTDGNTTQSLTEPDKIQRFATTHLEYVYDNTLNPAQNIWHGLRYKFFIDWNTDISKEKNNSGKYNFNWGVDARYYYPIYRNFIWAGRAAADFSWGNQKTIYYLGGADGWMMFAGNEKGNGQYRYFNPANTPDPDQNYAFQALALNMRGFIQNVANGNNAVTINSEFRLPVFTTLLDRPINNAFLRNFQVVQFIDLGTAWNGSYDAFKRPESIYTNPPISIKTKVGGVGPFAGGYGFGVRSTLLGYFLKLDAAWQMNGFFRGKPVYYFCMGLDF